MKQLQAAASPAAAKARLPAAVVCAESCLPGLLPKAARLPGRDSLLKAASRASFWKGVFCFGATLPELPPAASVGPPVPAPAPPPCKPADNTPPGCCCAGACSGAAAAGGRPAGGSGRRIKPAAPTQLAGSRRPLLCLGRPGAGGLGAAKAPGPGCGGSRPRCARLEAPARAPDPASSKFNPSITWPRTGLPSHGGGPGAQATHRRGPLPLGDSPSRPLL